MYNALDFTWILYYAGGVCIINKNNLFHSKSFIRPGNHIFLQIFNAKRRCALYTNAHYATLMTAFSKDLLVFWGFFFKRVIEVEGGFCKTSMETEVFTATEFPYFTQIFGWKYVLRICSGNYGFCSNPNLKALQL